MALQNCDPQGEAGALSAILNLPPEYFFSYCTMFTNLSFPKDWARSQSPLYLQSLARSTPKKVLKNLGWMNKLIKVERFQLSINVEARERGRKKTDWRREQRKEERKEQSIMEVVISLIQQSLFAIYYLYLKLLSLRCYALLNTYYGLSTLMVPGRKGKWRFSKETLVTKVILRSLQFKWGN